MRRYLILSPAACLCRGSVEWLCCQERDSKQRVFLCLCSRRRLWGLHDPHQFEQPGGHAGGSQDRCGRPRGVAYRRGRYEKRHEDAAGRDIPVLASGSVELKPGSLHVMLFGLNKELKAGDTFPLTLRYEKGGEHTVQVQVKTKN